MMGDRLSLSVVTATPARRKQKDQLRAGHTIPLSHSGRQASERLPCCHKESAVASPSRSLAGWRPMERPRLQLCVSETSRDDYLTFERSTFDGIDHNEDFRIRYLGTSDSSHAADGRYNVSLRTTLGRRRALHSGCDAVVQRVDTRCRSDHRLPES
jgi:hypothetical protein